MKNALTMMTLMLSAESPVVPTDETVIQGLSPDATRACIFEDDGVTGALYAVVSKGEEQEIADAVQIYAYVDGNASDLSYQIQVLWNETGDICALTIEGNLFALFDFDAKVGYNGSGFPEAGPGWRRIGSLERATERLQQ